ncbi:DUF2156 domain-containing protein [Oscillospiraceae bacterium WX1]
MNLKYRKAVQNTAIYLLVLIGIKNLAEALPWRAAQAVAHLYNIVVDPHAVVLKTSLSFLVGLLMLLLAHRLYLRVRLAWLSEIIMLTISVFLQVLRYHRFSIPIIMIELFVLAVLCLSHRDFSRQANRMTIKMAFIFIAVSVVLVLFNATSYLLLLKAHPVHFSNVWDALVSSAKLLFLLDKSAARTATVGAALYVDSLIVINWTCIIVGSFLLLKPIVYNPIRTRLDKEKVRNLVLRHGRNPMSYLALEDDKQYFFSSKVDGVCAYALVNDVFVICGDMLCSEKDSFEFLAEIVSHCRQNAYQILVMTISDAFAPLYRAAGFGLVKLGEECCFKLAGYSLAGGRASKVRAAVNHAVKAGVTVHEYEPTHHRSAEIERQITEISNEWLKTKGGYELRFTIGSTALTDPMDRRYFYATDADGKMLGFIVFLPYLSGYLADVTRRRGDAMQGVLELITYEAFMRMKAEGVEWGNLGLSPLFNVAESDKATMTEKLFNYIYENLNKQYAFKKLHHAKEKFAPTDWVPRYLAYYPKPFSPKLAYAIVRCQLKTGFVKLIFSQMFKKKTVTTP